MILDVHNYAKYQGVRLGGETTPGSLLADLWTRLANEFKDDDAVVFGLMNEPNAIDASQWAPIAQAAIDAIRATGARRAATGSPLADHLPQILQDVEDFDRDAGALSDRARLLYEEIETRIAATTNRSLSALTVISTLLLPPTFVAGAFGMNVGGIPWTTAPHGFWVALGLCLALIGLCYTVLRRFRILP